MRVVSGVPDRKHAHMRRAGCGQAIDSRVVCRYLQDSAACYPPCACERPSVQEALANLNNGVVPEVRV